MKVIREEDWGPFHDGNLFVPGQVGLYRTTPASRSNKAFQYWNGKFWGPRLSGPKHAFDTRGLESLYQNFDFQGLKEEYNGS